MLSRIRLGKYIFLSVIVLIVASAIAAGVFSHRRQRPNQELQKKVVALPPVVSHVPKLRIANISVRNLGTEDATAIVEILNTSNLAVMYVDDLDQKIRLTVEV